jgi:hypothetical protein
MPSISTLGEIQRVSAYQKHIDNSGVMTESTSQDVEPPAPVSYLPNLELSQKGSYPIIPKMTMDPATDLIFQPIDNTSAQVMYGTFGIFPPELEERTTTSSFSQSPFNRLVSLALLFSFVGFLLWSIAHIPEPRPPYSSLP